MTSSASTDSPFGSETSSPSVDSIESPCIDVCELDIDFVCVGCGRTIDEVLKWPQYTDEQKKAVLDRIFGDK